MIDTLNALDEAIVSAKRILEHGGASSSTDTPVVSSCAISDDLPELLRQVEEKALNLRREVHAMAKASTVDFFEEGLVRSAVAESSAHIQERSIDLRLLATLSSAIATTENENTCVVCLAAPKDSVVPPCKHLAMCALCGVHKGGLHIEQLAAVPHVYLWHVLVMGVLVVTLLA
jgi:hypothetical protein